MKLLLKYILLCVPAFFLFVSCSTLIKRKVVKSNIGHVILNQWEYYTGRDTSIDDIIKSSAWRSLSSFSENVKNKSGKNIYIRTVLPGWNGASPCVYLGQSDHCIQVYLNRDLIYQLGGTSSYKRTKLIGWDQNLIPLPFFKKGDILTINAWTDGYSIGLAGEALLGSYDEIVKKAFTQDYDVILLAIVFFVTGLISLIIYFNSPKTKLLLGISFFLIPVAVLFFVNSLFIQIMISAPDLFYQLDYLSLIGCTAGGFFLIEQISAEKYKKIIRRLWQIHLVILASAIIIINFTEITSTQLFSYFFIILTINIVISVVVMVLSAKNGNIESKLFIIGITGFFLFAVWEILLFYFDGLYNGFGYHFRVIYLGLLWFVIVLIKIAIDRYKEADRQKEILQLKELDVVKRENEARELFGIRLIESQENERNRIALELHDSLGQKLLLIKNQLMTRLRIENDADASLALTRIKDVTGEAIQEVRNISQNLRPQHLDQLGLTTAIETLIEKVEESSGIKFNIGIDNIDNLIPHENEINIYRILQESINNIIKHSKATEAYIYIAKSEEKIKLEIKDNGIGSGKEGHSQLKGMGIRGMYERARMIGAKIDFNFSDQAGSTVSLEYYLNRMSINNN